VTDFVLRPIGRVASVLHDRAEAPRQGDESAPDAWLEIAAEYAPALDGLAADAEILLLTWLDRADRDQLTVHPRGDLARPATGVFQTRSPDRPNPIGLHRVRVLAVAGTRVQVSGLEALDGTPILDLKPVIGDVSER